MLFVFISVITVALRGFSMMKCDGYDDCVIGADIRTDVLVYDARRIIFKLMEIEKLSYDEALEFAEFNIFGAYVGEGTPIFSWPQTFEEIAELFQKDL